MKLIRYELSDRVEYLNENGLYHREDGPALEYASGYKYWYINGKKHRLDGPACEFSNYDSSKKCFGESNKCWYLNDMEIPVKSQEEFERYLRLKVFI